MIRQLIFAAFVAGLSFSVQAGELDDETSITNQDLTGTMVIRIDQRDHSISFLQSNSALMSQDEASALIKDGEFQKLQPSNMKTELDNESGASSWYYYYMPYNYRWNFCLNWYGSHYRPYYAYSYGYYSYYYYGSYYRWW